MRSLLPSDGKEWLLLVAGFVAGWYIVGHAKTTGKSTPPGMG
ncbi:MAG: hypothetical protein ACRDUW_06515 [Pseudonocardiaceae bacterium]